MDVWLFGYGSLIWRPDIPFQDRRQAWLRGWGRRFWQGSHDHRGVPEQPGRVVTLVQDPVARCAGMAYLVDAEIAEETFSTLDHREKNGYRRHRVTLELEDASSHVEGVVYIAPVGNHAYLGPAPLEQMAGQIAACVGPSGRNLDYLLELADALRVLDCHDDHVFELEAEVLKITGARQPSKSASGTAP